MYYVYILASEPNPGSYYVGSTADLKRRIKEHNSGKSSHTAKGSPWALATYIAFADREKAFRFERYLKSGSGRALAKKHF
jgi:predicted GIY-YIG superfamily endonuclease